MTLDTTVPCPITADELFDSVNYFDELGIAKHFDADIYALREKPFAFLRAMAFIHLTHTAPEVKAADHAHAAKSLSIGQLGVIFPKPDDADDDLDKPEGDPFGEDAEGNAPTP